MWIRSLPVLVVSWSCSARHPAPLVTSVAIPLTAATASLAGDDTTRDQLSPPFTLSASDGSGLALTRVDAKAVVEGPLAFTELHLYFRNTEARTREGTFQITLPERAAISRFAMEHAGQWMEAEVVPKLVARRAYDDFLHRRQDPALLERAAGNQFTAKVFPIAANADKHLVISYSQELPGKRYTLPLRGLPSTNQIDVELAFTAADGSRQLDALHQRDWQPDRDFTTRASTTAAAIGANGAVAAQVEIGATLGRDELAALTLLVDTSGSRALGFTRYVATVRRLIAQLRGDLPLSVVAFDQDSQLVFSGPAGGFGDAHARALLERGAAGASDVGQALAWLAANRQARSRVVIVGDGVITAGLEGRELQQVIERLPGVERVDVALVGGLRDDRTATQRVSAKLPRRGAVLDLEIDPVVTALGERVATDVAIEVPGASWVSPRRIASARAGSRVMVYARGITSPTVDVIVGGNRQRLQILRGMPPLVDRAVAGAELAGLEAAAARASGDERTALRKQIAAKSVAARVLSSETSMLVLESDGDYARYGIDRTALADVLVVGPSGLEWRHRDAAPLPGPSKQPVQEAIRDPLAPPPPVTPPASARVTTGVDQDHDGILDAEDRCPDEPESYNGLDDGDGCPDRGRVIVTDTAITILEPIYFTADSARLDPRSRPILDAVAATLIDNKDILLLEVQGHTDHLGDAAVNLALSERRAEAVRRYLIDAGVEAQRLIAKGYGETQPRAAGTTAAGRARNRRVDFLILQRSEGTAIPAPPPTPAPPPPPPPPAVTGELAAIHKAIADRDLEAALSRARDWHHREPGNVLALIGLGEALEAKHAGATAARVYGSIIDLFPGRADMRRFAGERLARLPIANELAIDTFRRAVADRPDHLSGHRLLAYAYVRADRLADAFAAILTGLGGDYRATSYAGGNRILGDDAAIIGALYAQRFPARRADIAKALAARKLGIATAPSTRFVLHWETDANDVDLHVVDAKGNHAFYRAPKLATGGELYADVTTGYGPECFAIPGAPGAGPYELSVHYYAQGPMGYGMGVLEVLRFDGKRLASQHRPFVVMTNNAKLDLGAF